MRNDLGTEHAPSQYLIDRGADVFYGRVLFGPWLGYDIEVQVDCSLGKSGERTYYIFAEYAFNDEPVKGPELGPPDWMFDSLDDFWAWVTPHPIQWRPNFEVSD